MTELIITDSGNISFYGMGKPCPTCKCFFSSSRDFNLHRRVCPKPPEWKQSEFNDIDKWIWVAEDPRLKAAIIQNGGLLDTGDFKYRLNQTQTIIKRRPI